MKIISKLLLTLFFTIFLSIIYLSIFGIETKRFNKQIENKIKSIDQNLDIQLKTIKIIFDPFKFDINVKTIGPRLINKNKIIEIESLKTQISLKALIEKQFSIENLEVSTKSIDINNLLPFLRSLNQTPELYILDKIIKKGFLIADIKIEFNPQGKIKENFIIKGFIKDGKLSFNKRYNIDKINFIFDLKKNELVIGETGFNFNNLNFYSDEISIKREENIFSVKGEIDNKKFDLDSLKSNIFIKNLLGNLKPEEFTFSSKNSFSFNLSKKFELTNLEIISKVKLIEFKVLNNLDLKSFFPQIKEKITFLNNDLKIKYKNNELSINGEGKILFQDNADKISYKIKKIKNDLKFETSLKIINNPLNIDLLNYSKDGDFLINFKGTKKNNKISLDLFNLKENDNIFNIKDLEFTTKKQIKKIGKVNLNYFDDDSQNNSISLIKKDKGYILEGSYLNADNLVENIFKDKGENSNIFNIDTVLEVNVDKVRIDKNTKLSNLNGNLVFKNQNITKGNLEGFFSGDEKLKLTVNTSANNKITTLFLDRAEPIVKKYKFIKGFEGGKLDYYSTSNGDETSSTLKIYDFKLKELPSLTKILTLASLQGIADILSGEGIRFDEFEMNFKNKKDLITIEEIYAVGPAISVLMNGYIEKDRLISLRGTLVPATTINKFIGSLPVLGDILVGSKTGEGVFGVSFKIKGPPKKLETTVNPVKTLTPRFITRTLEKIKTN
tara:strand:+ start:291 stop:2468 length:2178 start_codon:yes stop_codon:yes gene_type:complete